MKRKAFNSLNEAALQVQHGTTPEPEVNDMVLEYFESYFGGTLNESTSDEDIMDAVYDLIYLTEDVLDVVGLNEYYKHSQIQEPDYKNTDSMFSQEQEFRDFPKKYNAKTMKNMSKKDFAKTKKKLKKIHSRMKDNYGSSLDRDSANQETNDAKGWPSWKTNYH